MELNCCKDLESLNLLLLELRPEHVAFSIYEGICTI